MKVTVAAALPRLGGARPRSSEEACALLDESTLETAGGLRGCERTLSQARGIRIHVWIAAVLRSPLGSTIRFTTRRKGDTTLRQQLLVSPDGRIVAVIPEP